MLLFTYLVRQAQASCDHSVLLCPWATFAGGEWALVNKMTFTSIKHARPPPQLQEEVSASHQKHTFSL